jgi:hypothetical protein
MWAHVFGDLASAASMSQAHVPTSLTLCELEVFSASYDFTHDLRRKPTAH